MRRGKLLVFLKGAGASKDGRNGAAPRFALSPDHSSYVLWRMLEPGGLGLLLLPKHGGCWQGGRFFGRSFSAERGLVRAPLLAVAFIPIFHAAPAFLALVN